MWGASVLYAGAVIREATGISLRAGRVPVLVFAFLFNRSSAVHLGTGQQGKSVPRAQTPGAGTFDDADLT